MPLPPQLEFICRSYSFHKLTYHIDHHGIKWMTHQLPIPTHMELVTFRQSRKISFGTVIYIIFHLFGTFYREKLELFSYVVHYMGRSRFANLGSKTLKCLFKALNNSFGGYKFSILAPNLLMLCYALRYYQRFDNHLNWNLYVEFMPSTSLLIILTTMVSSE